MCFDAKQKLCSKAQRIMSRMSFIITLSLDVCLFRQNTTAMLSQINRNFFVAPLVTKQYYSKCNGVELKDVYMVFLAVSGKMSSQNHEYKQTL